MSQKTFYLIKEGSPAMIVAARMAKHSPIKSGQVFSLTKEELDSWREDVEVLNVQGLSERVS